MMFNLKKYFGGEELLQIALLLSLLRIDRRSYISYDTSAIGLCTHNVTDSWEQLPAITSGSIHIHPKSVDLNYEQDVLFNELNLLGTWNNVISSFNPSNLMTYLFNVNDTSNIGEDASPVPVLFPPAAVPSTSARRCNTDLSQEDLDIIEVLWKHDLHFDQCRLKDEKDDDDEATQRNDEKTFPFPPDEPDSPDGSRSITPDLFGLSIDPLRRNVTTDANEEIHNNNVRDDSVFEDDSPPSTSSDPLWSSSMFSSDYEASPILIKERIIKDERYGSECVPDDIESLLSPPSYDDEFSLQSTLPLIDLNAGDHPQRLDLWSRWSAETASTENSDSEKEDDKEEANSEEKEDAGIEIDFLESVDIDFLIEMIHTPQIHHPRPLQSRGISPYMRSMGVEQHRWQDFPSGFLPDPNHSFYHHHHHYHQTHSMAATTNYNNNSTPSSSSTSLSPSASAAPVVGPYSPHLLHPHHQLQLPSSSSCVGENSPRSSLLHNTNTVASTYSMSSASDINGGPPSSSYPMLNGNCSIGSAVTSSMHLTNSSVTESIAGIGPTATNPEPVHNGGDSYPYQNNYGAEMNHSTEGFLSTILNDEDLQLMDIGINEGMCTMRMMDNNTYSAAPQNCVERNTDSDSAVSSMGSERVPSLSSDTEWMETNSDSGHNPMDHYSSSDCNGKYRWYDNYMYSSRFHHNVGESGSGTSATSRMPLVPQKKYQLYGRRYFQDQQNIGFNRLDSVAHNHTYHLPSEIEADGEHFMTKPIFKDKSRSKFGRKEDEQLGRDEKRARSLNIPISVQDIINLPMDEFNERLSKYDLSESQLSLIRDIRRRGKNKVAAQNCRKRKLDQIMSLADEVKQMKNRKGRLIQDRDYLVVEKQRIQNVYGQLYRHVFQSLRDPDGNPYSHYEYSLQQSADGSVILVPRNSTTTLPSLDGDSSSQQHNSRTKRKDPGKS